MTVTSTPPLLRLDQQLAHWAARQPARAALIAPEARLSFAELQQRSEAMGEELRALGIRPNDVVAFQLPNLVDAFVLYHAAIRIDAIVVPILPAMRQHDLTYMIGECCARLLVTVDNWRGFDHALLARNSCGAGTLVAVVQPQGTTAPAKKVLQLLGHGLLPASTNSLPASVSAQAPADDLDRICSMIFTSGTSGRPKAVTYSHRNLGIEGREMASVESIRPDDILFVPPSIAHVSGICFGLYMPMAAGSTVCLMPEWNSDAAIRLIEREGCTWTAGATPFLQGIVEAAGRNPDGLKGLRVFRCGGASVPPALIRRAREFGIDAYRCYGMSEHPTVSGRAGQADDACIHSDGVIHPLVEMMVVDPADPGRVLPPGEAGEVAVRGPDQSRGYLREADTSSSRYDGWFLTGDIGRLSADRVITITGRKKDIIIRKGENIASKELEDLIVEHPSVREVAVVGMPDVERGEMVCCVVVPRDGQQPTLADICGHLKKSGVATYKLPERLACVSALPHNAGGKVLKTAIKQALSEASPDQHQLAEPA